MNITIKGKTIRVALIRRGERKRLEIRQKIGGGRPYPHFYSDIP